MAEEYIAYVGEVRAFAFGFIPNNWLACDGQVIKVNQYMELFSLLGTTYGGDGKTTFGLPDLRGRMIIDQGQGPGLTARRLGEKGGQEAVSNAAANAQANAGSNMPPFLALNYCICSQGKYPER